MADFNPFAENGEIRSPTAAENDLGFPCGPFDLPLWNFLFMRIESEIKAVIVEGGILESDGDFTQLLQAIQAMIAAATGVSAPDTSGFLLMDQARSRLPIYPHVTNAVNGQFGVTAIGGGQVRVPASVGFLHRGIMAFSSAQTDLNTNATKTYHLRALLTGVTPVYSLKDLADVVYNPGVLVETDESFDSTYDDALIARVVTNVSNVATVTNLANLDRLFHRATVTGASGALSINRGSLYTGSTTYNWSRTPKSASIVGAVTTGGSGAFMEYANLVYDRVITRYGATAKVESNWKETASLAPPTALTGFMQFDMVG